MWEEWRDLVGIQHCHAVFHAEGAADEGDDVIAEVGVQIVLGSLGLIGFLGDIAFEGGAAGDEESVAGDGGAGLLTIAKEGGDLGDE